MNRAYYSVAFKRWRNEALRDNISWFLTGVVVLVVLLVIWHRFIKPKRVARRVKGGKTA